MVVVAGNNETKQIKGLCLYHFGACVASQKVRACLEAKKLEWQSRIVSPKDMASDWYFAIHPQGLVPTLVHDGVTHIESADIMVYLDEAFPEVPLRPATPEGKQEVQSWLDLESTIQMSMKYLTFYFLFGSFAKLIETEKRLAYLKAKNPEGYAFHKMVRDGAWKEEDLKTHIEKIHNALQKLENRLRDHEWLVGDQVSLAEYCWGPDVYSYVGKINFPMARYPAVREWYNRLVEDTAFQKAAIAYGGGPPKALLTIKNAIQQFLGRSIDCFEKEVKPNWTPALILTLALPLCFTFLPYDSIATATGVSSTVTKTCLVGLWTAVFYSAYKKAHTATKAIYLSGLDHMKALLLKSYERETPLAYEDIARPKVVLPHDVLVRVHAASINPIDLVQKEGYGKSIVNFIRGKKKLLASGESELPIILGKDFSGVVEAVGGSVSKVKVGDEVWASLPFFTRNGALAEYALVQDDLVSMKPKTLTHTESASIPYIAATAWTALVNGAGLDPQNTSGKRVLILCGTGGVGSFAIQLVKAWGGHVTTTCSTSGQDMVTDLGADEVVDYTKMDLESALKDKPKFDVILESLGPSSYQSCLNLCKRGGTVVTLRSPALIAIDKYGFVLGIPKAIYDLLRISLPQKLFYGRSFKYGFAAPSGHALDAVGDLVEQGKIKPVVEKVYNLEDGNDALQHVQKGHARGKTVVVVVRHDG